MDNGPRGAIKTFQSRRSGSILQRLRAPSQRQQVLVSQCTRQPGAARRKGLNKVNRGPITRTGAGPTKLGHHGLGIAVLTFNETNL